MWAISSAVRMSAMAEPFRIDRKEALRYLGLRGQEPDAGTAALLERAAGMLLETARPRTVWKTFELRETEEGLLLPTAGLLLTGKAIRRHLCGCTRCILMAATLGLETDRLVLRTQLGSMALAAVLDACASAAVEDVCNQLCAGIARQLERTLTFRFSPGYGDLPLALQQDFIRSLDTPRKIGLTLTESCMLAPQKSVTAVLGIRPPGEAMPRETDSCAGCNLRGRCSFSRDEG